MKILIDCDVLLDVALKRDPFYADSAGILEWSEQHPGRAGMAWHTLANLAYFLEGDSRSFLMDLMTFARVAATGHDSAEKALRYPMSDFEDALQAAAAVALGASLIVTRNEKDYRSSPVPAISPRAFLKKTSMA